jgi:hypothetical protein
MLDSFELIRLSRDVPGSAGLRYLLSAPLVLPPAELSPVCESGGTTSICQLVPLYTQEADRAAELDDDGIADLLESLRPHCTDLHRQPAATHDPTPASPPK